MPPKTSKYKEDLISRIGDLIKGYSSASILKEYLQNADDSGATELVVTFDKQNYQKLKGTKYESAMGTSLLLANNSIFKEKDFDSIVRISAQGKSLDAGSTGHFGQGFSSSFSISDHPTFLSNNRIYWFDVLKTAVSKDETDDILHWEDNDFNEITDWLNTFKVAGFDDSTPYKGTIFRLPLRCDNNDSKISNEVFTFKNFLLWCDEWKDKAENLLFLRNIHTLTLQEIDENGNKIVHLEIKTKNSEEIQNINNSIQAEFGDDGLIDICNRWKSSEIDLPLFSYHHNFSIVYWNRKENKKEHRDKTWAVVNGLFRGKNNCLIDKGIDVLKNTYNPGKVLPWAGVAVELNNGNEPVKNESMFFTFLPLPIKSKYPIHIHGWFDLNPKRTEITSSGSEYGKTIVQWNELLLKEGVGKAWALLIDYLKIEKSSHYNFWARDTEFELNDKLNEGFYKSISKLNCLYVTYKSKEKWVSPKEIDLHYFKDEKNQVLLNAFKEHFSIISPKPNKFIIENFKNIDIELTEITSEYIRNYLIEKSNAIEFPIVFDEVPIFMLSKKEWLLEILKYCADNGKDYTLLNKLPLELTLSNEIYEIGTDTLFNKNPNLKLFQGKEYLLDVDIVNTIDNIETLPNNWLMPTLKNQIIFLPTPESFEDLTITKEWIEEVVNLIANSSQENFDEAKDVISELQIVYQENKEYGKLHIENYSPFIPRDEDIENNLIYLEEIEMNVVHHEYVEIYKPLLKYGLIRELISETLIKHLLQLDSFEFFKKKNTRKYLLDILTEDISWFEDLSYFEKSTLESMPFIGTVTDNIYSKKNTNTKLFLPTDFTPPEHIQSLKGEYELITVDTKSKLFELYKKMGIEEQSINNYIQKIIIPFLENNQNLSDNKEVLKWLMLEPNIDDVMLDKLKYSRIIPSFLDEKSLYKASELYLPTIELPDILNDNKYKPIKFNEEKVQNSWISFLKNLKASPVLLSQHIEDRVKKIVEDNNKEDAIALLNYIANNFEIFEEMNILNTLKEYDWYPVEESQDLLKPKSEYTKLKRADELILFDDLKIGGGYYYILDRRVKLGKKDEKGDYTERDMADKLGIVINIPNERFFESFRELMKLPPQNGQVVNYTKDVYKYIGRRFKSETIDFDMEERTVLINNKWIAPKYIYQHQINLTGIYSWGSLVENEIESNLAKGLISLGVQEKPTFDFFIEQLQKLPQEQDLNSNQLKDAKALLQEIQSEDENLFCSELPILTGNNQLVLSSNLYINDLPAYKNSNDKNKNLKFCQGQFVQLAKKLDVLTLIENHTSKISDYEECEGSHLIIVNILERDSFKEGILRLLYHEKKIKEDEINESILHEVLPSSLIFVSQLIIKYSIEDNFLFSSNETTYEENGELYILEQDDEDDMIEIIAKYICDTKDLSRDSFGWIERILRNKMSREEIHDFLDKKKVIELPQKFDIEDEVNIFDNSHPVELDEEIIYDDSTNQEENYIEKSNESKGEIVPPIKPKASYENENTNNHNTLNRSNTMGGGNKSSSNSSSNKSNKKIVSSNDRKPVYVGKEREVDEEEEKSKREGAKEIGDKGENYVLENKEILLISKTNYFEKAPTDNKGFDIYEKDESGQTIRYIEVKTLTGQWGQGGVGITKDQLGVAQQEKDKWWLFVVENINTDNTKVYQFKNPILEANRFMFDNSWKQLAYQSENIENQEPKIYDKYEIEIEGAMKIGIVTNVKRRGVLFQVDLTLENGKEIKKKKFNKSWRKIDG